MPEVLLLLGPRDSGRAAQADVHLRQHSPAARMLVPTQAYAQQRTRDFLLGDTAFTGCFGRPIGALRDFARQLVEAEGEHVVLLDDWERTLLLRRALQDAARTGALGTLPEAAATPGFANHLGRLITQLKQAALEPEEFARRVAPRAHPLDPVVAAVYTHYQAALRESGRFDTPGLFWRAYALASEATPRILQGVDTLICDGFEDFTPSELRLLEALAPALRTLIFGLNLDLDPDRADLYAVPRRTAAGLRRMFSPREEHFAPPAPESLTAYTARHLFWRSRPAPAAGLADDLRVATCIDAQHEVSTIVREVKALLLEESLSPGEIAVVYPDPAAALPALAASFAEAGVPLRASFNLPLSEGRLGRCIVRLLDAWQDYAHDAVLAVLCDPWFHAEHAALFPVLARAACINEGRDGWARATRELAQNLAAVYRRELRGLVRDDDTLTAAAHALADAFDALAAADAHVGEASTLPDQIAALSAALEDLGFAAHARAKAPEEWHAWLQALAALHAAPKDDTGFRGLVRESLRAATFPHSTGPSGVRLLDLGRARNLRFDYVFAAGLNEGAIPAPPAANAVYGDADRIALRRYDITLESAAERAEQDLLRFHHLFYCARRRLMLSYRLLSESGREASLSPYLDDLRDLLDPWPQAFLPAPANDAFIATCARAASPRDLRNALFLRVRENRPAEWCADAEHGAAIEAARYSSEPFGAWDAVLQNAEAKALLAERYGPARNFSVSQLETYAGCPFRFYSEQVLHIRKLDPPTADADARLIGTVVHHVLTLLHARWPHTPAAQFPPGEVEAAVDAAIEQSLARSAAHLRSLPHGVVVVERARLRTNLLRYLAQERDEPEAGWAPLACEFAFGPAPPEDPELEATAAPADVFILETKAGPVRFTGRIDRIDENGALLRAIDYKTGSAPKPGEITSGRQMQLTVYAWALERHLFPGRECVAAYYVPIGREERCEALRKGEKRYNWPQREANTEQQIVDAITGMRVGYFPPVRQGDRCYGCGRAHACRHEQARIARKTGERAEVVEELK